MVLSSSRAPRNNSGFGKGTASPLLPDIVKYRDEKTRCFDKAGRLF